MKKLSLEKMVSIEGGDDAPYDPWGPGGYCVMYIEFFLRNGYDATAAGIFWQVC